MKLDCTDCGRTFETEDYEQENAQDGACAYCTESARSLFTELYFPGLDEQLAKLTIKP